MSSSETLQALDSFLKTKPTKRDRKQRAKESVQSLVKTAQSSSEMAKRQKTQKTEKSASKSRKRLLKHRAAMLKHGDQIMSKEEKDLKHDVLKIIKAREMHKKPKLKKRKRNLTFFDFEDNDD